MTLTRDGDGWAFPFPQRRAAGPGRFAHYLRDGQALCGYAMSGNELREPDDGIRFRDDCTKCLVRLDARRITAP